MEKLIAEPKFQNQINKNRTQTHQNSIPKLKIPSKITKIWFRNPKFNPKWPKFNSDAQNSIMESPKFDPETLIPLTTKIENPQIVKIF